MHNFWVSAGFGNRGPHSGGVHGGLDFAASHGESIYAVDGGRVDKAEWQGSAGNAVTVKLKDGRYTLYGHMSRIATRKGARIKAGAKIGEVGSSGNSTGPHLHLQIQRGGESATDPLSWLGVSTKRLDKFGRD